MTRSHAGAHGQERLLGKNCSSPGWHQLSQTALYIIYWLKQELPTGYQFIVNLCSYYQNSVRIFFFFSLFFFPLTFSLSQFDSTLFLEKQHFLIIKSVSRTVSHFQSGRNLRLVWKNRTQSVFQLSEILSCKGPCYGSQYHYNPLYKQVTKYLVG